MNKRGAANQRINSSFIDNPSTNNPLRYADLVNKCNRWFVKYEQGNNVA